MFVSHQCSEAMHSDILRQYTFLVQLWNRKLVGFISIISTLGGDQDHAGGDDWSGQVKRGQRKAPGGQPRTKKILRNQSVLSRTQDSNQIFR